jgi:hypothetical protein
MALFTQAVDTTQASAMTVTRVQYYKTSVSASVIPTDAATATPAQTAAADASVIPVAQASAEVSGTYG